MEFEISGFGSFVINNILFDLNGSLAIDGVVDESIKKGIRELAQKYRVVIASADIHNNLEELASDMGVEYYRLSPGKTSEQKVSLLRTLGSLNTVAIGNGSNDAEMLKEAAIGIAIIRAEGGSIKAIINADLIVTSIDDAIRCLLIPKRIVASLRD